MDINSVAYKEKLAELRKTHTVKEISEILGISERTLSRHMKEFGLTKPSSRSDILDDDVLRFWNDGFTIVEIANYYSCSHETIAKRLAKHGIVCDRPAGIRKHFARVRSGVDDIGSGMVHEDDSSTVRKHGDGGRRDKLGLDGFIERVRAVHGGIYDYSKVEYKNTKTKVCIVCPEHGEFMQTPEKHMAGQGCPLCANDKLEATNMKRYGVRRPLQSVDIHKKAVESAIARFGVSNFTSLPEIQAKTNETKRKNCSFSKSDTEDLMYGFLCDLFGTDDVKRQYFSEVYPSSCDFYIKSRDMYIEFNGTWTHNDHWFDSESELDKRTLDLWRSRVPGHPYYKSAIDTWTRSDPKKRTTAEQNGLNYVVFWDNNFSDFYEWVEDDCPDRQDWVMNFRKNTISSFCLRFSAFQA